MNSSKLAVIANIAVPIVAALVVNGIIYAMRWNSEDRTRAQSESSSRLLPPGGVIAAIWVVIFGFLGYTRYLVRYDPVANASVIVLLLLCLSYPFITAGLDWRAGVIANVVTLIFGFGAAIPVYACRRLALAFMAPLLVWLSYVNIVSAVICSSKIKRAQM